MAAEAEDRRAHARLIPWMPRELLVEFVAQDVEPDVGVIQAIGERSADLGAADIWEAVVRRVHRDEPRTSACIDALSGLGSRSAALVAPTLAAATETFEAPTNVVHDLAVTITAADPEKGRVTLVDEAKNTYSAVIPDDLTADLEDLEAESELTATLYEDAEGEWVAARFTSTSDEPHEWGRSVIQTTVEARNSMWDILDAIEAEADSEASEWLQLLRLHYHSAEDERRAAELIDRRVIARVGDGFAVADALVHAIRVSARFVPTEAVAATSLLRLPPDVIHERAEAIGTAIVAHALRADGEEAGEWRRLLPERMHDLNVAAFAAGSLSRLAEARSRFPRKLQAVEMVLVPVLPSAASAWLIETITTAVQAAGEAQDHEAEQRELSPAMECIALLTTLNEHHPALRPGLAELPLRAVPSYASAVMSLFVRFDVDRDVSPAFLAAAGQEDPQVTLGYANDRRRLSREQLEAVLAFVARANDADEGLRDLARATMSKHQATMPVLDQLAFVASAGSARAASQFSPYRQLLRRLFIGAQRTLNSRPRTADMRLRGAEAWRTDRRSRKEAARGYVGLFKAVRTAGEMKIVVASCLRFFQTPGSVKDVVALRGAALDALERIGRSRDQELYELVESARTNLRWETQSDTRAGAVVRRVFGQQG
jgi:hypothetical protein